MQNKVTIFWFRQDLRISDNPGLFEAAKQGMVIPVYILNEKFNHALHVDNASQCWLQISLQKLNESLGHKLNVYAGNPKQVLLEIIKNNQAHAVYWNRCYEPSRIKEDADIKKLLKEMQVECKSFNGSLLREPWDILKSDGLPYKVYTPFCKKGYLQHEPPRHPIPAPAKLTLMKASPSSLTLANMNLMTEKIWCEKIKKTWDIGELAAQKKLDDFLENGLLDYKEYRNYPGKKNVSRLSAHLHFGEISPNQMWHSAQAKGLSESWLRDLDCFFSELVWREFAYYLLYHFPDFPEKNFQEKFDRFPWECSHTLLNAWKKGKTGYPIVDAGMRELWQTGYMHNRVRMVVASFLVKNLLQHWHHGAAWFSHCLVDADLASNSISWQWVAGSGVDAAPYFRIFNPTTQGETFDPEGKYTRQFVPELSGMPDKFLFKPWDAPEKVLNSAGVILGSTYPKPIVDLKITRERALKAYKMISNQETGTI